MKAHVKSTAPDEHIEIDNGTYLRWLRVDDADTIARAVGESLEHLRPWMPWAGPESADPAFQRERLRRHPWQRERGEEWQYGLIDSDDAFLGAFGLTSRRGPGTLEIGYWMHVEAGSRGFATNAARALTDAGLRVRGVDRIVIVTDERNVRSAAIPQRLGFRLDRVETRAPEAPGESGRMQIWVSDRKRSALTR